MNRRWPGVFATAIAVISTTALPIAHATQLRIAGPTVDSITNGRIAYSATSSDGAVKIRSTWRGGLHSTITSGADPTWSPDGLRLAITARIGDAAYVATMDADGSDVALLRRGSIPIWSPDGTHFAFTGPTGDLRVMGSDGAGPVSLGPVVDRPSWSPAGDELAVLRDRYHLERIAADGSGATVIATAEPGARLFQPAWSPDGEDVAFAVGLEDDLEDPPLGIRIVPADGGTPEMLVPLSAVAFEGLAWSPDGSRLAFSARFGSNCSAFGRLYVVGADGSDLTEVALDASEPDWAPDGGALAYTYRFASDLGGPCPEPETGEVGVTWFTDRGMTHAEVTERTTDVEEGSPAWRPVPCSLLGTDGDDVLAGTAGPDTVCGLAGNDRITGVTEGDIIQGGSGRDVIDLTGSPGVVGGLHVGRLGDGAFERVEEVVGGSTDDHLGGAPIASDIRRPSVDGGGGGDELFFTDGVHLLGGEGKDYFGQELNFVSLFGRPMPAPYFEWQFLSVDGGEGRDTLDLGWVEQEHRAPIVDLGSGTVRFGTSGGVWMLGSLERVDGSDIIDTLLGSPAGDVLVGHIGRDVIRGRAGNDRLLGGSDRDRIVGGRGFDTCRSGPGPDEVRSCEAT